MRKGIVLMWLLLLFCFVGIGTASAATWTVDDDGGADFTRIQDAVDAASAGDMIIVNSGTYYENVNVTKQLILRGVDTGTGKPVVDASGSGSAITLSMDGIMLEGFKATNTSGSWSNAGIKVTSNDNTITGNNASNNYYCGIGLYCSNSNNITDNNVCNFGIYLYCSYSNSITDNNVCNNADFGIFLDCSSSNNITGNNASNNNYDGIFLYFHSNNNIITGNNASNNNEDGIRLFSSSNNNIITGNNARYNNHSGIHLSSYSDNNIITGNNVRYNDEGIRLHRSSSNTITTNNASNNNDYGIYLHSSSGNTVYNNYFNNTNNAWDNGNNIWNITKTAETNIIGGSWLGGNYWSDYAGEDSNGDGLGDTLLPYNSSGNIQNGGDWLPLVKSSIFDTDTGAYPSISGVHNGTITLFCNISVSTLYTYPCVGTGGHTESIELYENGIPIANGTWNGYQGDYHNIIITPSVILQVGHTYNYTIVTGSYPQIIHAESKDVTGGTITCTEFTDANGRVYYDWIPAIRLG